MSEFDYLAGFAAICMPNQNIEKLIEKVIMAKDFLDYIMTNIQNKCSDIYLEKWLSCQKAKIVILLLVTTEQTHMG